MGYYPKTPVFEHGLLLASLILAAIATAAGAAAPQVEVVAEKATAEPNATTPHHKTYALADLPAITIFGNDRTADRMRALATIKITSPDQIKGLIEDRGGDGLILRVADRDHANRVRLKATAQTQVTVDGRNVKMMDLKPLQAALVTTSSDCSKALKIEAQTLPQSGDGKTHQILAMAAADPKGSRLYVVEAVADLGEAGAKNGEYLLWTLSPSGHVIHKELLKKKDDSYDPPSGTHLLPLAGPRQGAVMMGPFGKLSGIHQWCLFCVDGQDKSVAELKGIWNCQGVVWTADHQGILAVGNNVGVKRMDGMLWNLDLDGKVRWKRSYERRTLESFNDIVLADDQGGFIIAEESPKEINKFGVGECSVWLLRCDSGGKVLTETTFAGRQPRIQALGDRRFAVLYDAETSLAADWRLRVVDLKLNEQWERQLPFAGFAFDPPGLCSTVAGGLVLVGPAGVFVPGGPMGKFPDQPRPGLEVVQWDREGRTFFSASIPAVFPAQKHDIHVACASDGVYVAVRTAGVLFRDGMESSICRIPLPTSQ